MNRSYVFEGVEKECPLERRWQLENERKIPLPTLLPLPLLPSLLLFCHLSALATALSKPKRRSYNPVEGIMDFLPCRVLRSNAPSRNRMSSPIVESEVRGGEGVSCYFFWKQHGHARCHITLRERARSSCYPPRHC